MLARMKFPDDEDGGWVYNEIHQASKLRFRSKQAEMKGSHSDQVKLKAWAVDRTISYCRIVEGDRPGPFQAHSFEPGSEA
jgi:hypothetical protein